MSENRKGRRLQEGWRPSTRSMRPTAAVKKPPVAPPKPSDSGSAKPKN